MNRKQRRELRKDKNLIIELYSIIKKYLPDLFDKFEELTDVRHQSYVTYNMKTICVTRLFGLICGLTSLSNISSDDFNTDACITNISNICNTKLSELPYWETIQDVFMNIKISELKGIQKYIVKTLLRSKMFDKYKFEGAFQLLFDGTGLSNHNYNLNGNCLKRKHKDGKISYYKYVLECKLVANNIVISLDSEFIITGDGLYATTPIINICKKYHWSYIFNLKPDRLKEINDTFEGNIKLLNETTKANYFLSSNIEFNKNILNVFKYIEVKENKTTTFRYISNIQVNDDNIDVVVKLGRNRWKIENEGFYTQKHRTFDITHLNSRNDNSMKCHYYFIQFAHTIRQLLEPGNLLTKSLKLKIKEVSANLLKSLTSTISDLNNLETNFQLRFDD